MIQDLLTITGIAQKLGMPESTVRYYRNKFSNFIPSIGEGRKKRYRPETVEIIAFIEKMFQDNRTAIEIAEHLAHKFPQNIEVEMEPQQLIATSQQPKNLSLKMADMLASQTQALKQLALVLDKFYNHERELRTLSDEVVFLRKQLQRVRHNHKYDNELETLSDEIIYLRKKVGNGHGNGNNGLDKKYEEVLRQLKQLEQSQNNGLHKKYEEILTNLKQLEENQIEAKFNLATKEHRIRELENKFVRVRKPWWLRWFRL